MVDTIRSQMAQVIYDVDGKQEKPDGTALTLQELFETPIEQLDIDSLSFLEIVMEIENHFDIELSDVDPDDYLKFADLEADLIKVAKGAQAPT